MEFDVCLTISGLCMFVPGEGADGRPAMHVLMPASTHAADAAGADAQGGEHSGGAHAAHHHAARHVVQLIYDARYHREEDVPEAERGKPCRRQSLDDCTVVVRHRLGQTLDASVEQDRVPLLDSTVGFGGVSPGLLRDPLSERLAARAELRIGSAEHYSGVGMGGGKKFRLCTVDHDTATARCDPDSSRPPQQMAEHVEWWLGRYRDAVALTDLLEITDRRGKPVSLPRGRLKPLPRKNVVHLRLLHAVPGALPERKCRQYDFENTHGGDHFEMYYQLDDLPDSVPHAVVEATSVACGSELSNRRPAVPSVVCVVSQARRRQPA